MIPASWRKIARGRREGVFHRARTIAEGTSFLWTAQSDGAPSGMYYGFWEWTPHQAKCSV